MDYLYWGAIAILVVFIILQIYDIFIMRSRSEIDNFLADEESHKSLSQRVGEAVIRKSSFLETWQTYLTWAHMAGKMSDWTMAQVVFISLIFGGLGLLAPLFFSAPAARLLPLAAVLPLLRVRSVGMMAKKATERTVPETSALISAELSAGSSVEDAITRAAELPGTLSRILDRAVDRAASVGRPLTSRGNQEGVLREVLGELNLPALRGFAVQLDTVAQSGVDSAERMREISSTLAAEYRQRVRDSINALDKRLTLAVSAFYFAPFFLILLVGTFSAAVGSF